MRKKIATLLIVGSLGALCAGLCACNSDTKLDEYYKNGNVISVTYDGSGGNILGGSNVSIVDMFNPDKYPADADGYVHIKLREPTDPARPHAGAGSGGSAGSITVSRQGYSLVGWYQTRNYDLKDGKVVDEAGNVLTEKDGDWYLVTTNDKGEEIEEKAIPAYTYSDPWDFKSDRVDFKKGEERYDMTLYAAWVKLFEFEYYYKPTEASDWTKFGTTNFNYIQAQKTGDDSDVVYVPDWSEETGRMDHSHGKYSFPALRDMTFKAAYSDEACMQPVTLENPLRHAGSVDFETAKAVDSVQKVYVEFDEGNYYRISKASQFADIGDATGYYTILNDLDFMCEVSEGALTFPKDSSRWPATLMTAEFTGRIEGEGGKPVKFKNVGAQYSVGNREAGDYSNATLGGLFGRIKEGASIKNVTFENVIFDIQVATSNLASEFGMFAGEIEEKATLENVTIGGKLRLGRMRNTSQDGFSFHLIANGNNGRVKKTQIVLMVFGRELSTSEETGLYEFDINPAAGKTTVDGNGFIKFENTPEYPVDAKRFEGQYHTIEYQTEIGGQNHE